MSLPAPMKPRPPAMDTAAASFALAIKRIGAQLMSGDVVHGYVVVRDESVSALLSCDGVDMFDSG
jgi:hypothetical protein